MCKGKEVGAEARSDGKRGTRRREKGKREKIKLAIILYIL